MTTVRVSLLAFLLLLSAAVLSPAAGSSASALSAPPFARFYSRRHHCRRQPALICVLRPTDGSTVHGVVKFHAVRNRFYRPWRRASKRCHVLVTATVHGLTAGMHGLHIHTYGDLRSADATGTGGHFLNPRNRAVSHGMPGDRRRHWGDFGNVLAHDDGTAHMHAVDRVIRTQGIVGRAIVVHAGQDMGKDAQPSGASGPRRASCVIGFANPEL